MEVVAEALESPQDSDGGLLRICVDYLWRVISFAVQSKVRSARQGAFPMSGRMAALWGRRHAVWCGSLVVREVCYVGCVNM